MWLHTPQVRGLSHTRITRRSATTIYRYTALGGVEGGKVHFQVEKSIPFFFFFFCTHQRFRLCARPLTLITPHLCIHLHRILSSEERCASISEHFSPFHVYIQCSTARAELVRKNKPKKKKTTKKRPHVECLFQCDSLHFRFMSCSL